MGDTDQRSWMAVTRLRIRFLAARAVQFSGFYLIALSLWTLFDPILAPRGLGVAQLPAIAVAPFASLDVSPLISLLVGFVVVWFATSDWFLGAGA